jgi:hypothetical protein
MRLALADAFDLGSVQRIAHPTALVLAVFAHPEGQRQRVGEGPAQGGIVLVLRTMSSSFEA